MTQKDKNLSKKNLNNYYDKDYFESGNKSGYKDYNKGFNYYKHRLRDYHRALTLIINFKPKRVLDLGCAFGYLVGALRTFGVEAYGVDISEYSVKNAPESIKPFLFKSDISKLHFEDNFFDLVVSYDVLEHIPSSEIPKVLKEIKRVSSKNLFFEIFVDKFISRNFGVDDPSHVSVFPASNWKKIFENAEFKKNKKFILPHGIYLGTKTFSLIKDIDL